MIMLLLLGTASVLGAACLPIEGDRILGKDLAAAHPAFSALAPEQPFGYAPAPGARRVFRRLELERLAGRQGLSLEPVPEICFERVLEPLRTERILEVMRTALPPGEARLELLDFSRHPVPRGELKFPWSGLRATAAAGSDSGRLWRGHVKYSGNRTAPVWARVKISTLTARVVAARNLPAGRPIEAAELRVESGDEFPFGEPSLNSFEHAVGRLPRRLIRAGQPVRASLLLLPKEIERGDQVAVEVSSGGAQLRFNARAESGGHTGDAILVKNPVSRRNFRARVEKKGKVVLNPLSGEPIE